MVTDPTEPGLVCYCEHCGAAWYEEDGPDRDDEMCRQCPSASELKTAFIHHFAHVIA